MKLVKYVRYNQENIRLNGAYEGELALVRKKYYNLRISILSLFEFLDLARLACLAKALKAINAHHGIGGL